MLVLSVLAPSCFHPAKLALAPAPCCVVALSQLRPQQRLEKEAAEVVYMRDELDRFKNLAAERAMHLEETTGKSLGVDQIRKPTKLPYSDTQLEVRSRAPAFGSYC